MRFVLPVSSNLLGIVKSVVVSSVLAGPLLAAPGDLDPSFGVGGKQSTYFFNDGNSDRAYPRAIAEQADGKLVIAGKANSNITGNDFVVARYNVDGTLDLGFGSNGIARTDFFGLGDEAGGVAILPDGKIIAGGRAVIQFIDHSADSAFALARYNPDGSLDTTFGTGGKVVTNFRDSLDDATSLLLLPDGKIILAGYVTQGANTGATYDFAVARYNADGSLDTTFGDGGKTFTDFSGSGDRSFWSALQPDGKIVLAGMAFSSATGADFALARYNANGSPDLTFGGTGRVTTNFAGNFDEFAWSVAIAPDGRIVAAGWADNAGAFNGGKADIAVARYNSDGTLDPTFNGTGRWTQDISGENNNEYGRAVTVQSDGKILVVGSSGEFHIPSYTHVDFAMLRLNIDGSRDNTFRNGGLVYTDFGEFDPPGPSGDSADAIRILRDGRIVVAGTATYYRYRFDFAIARYFGDPVAAGPVPASAVSRKLHNGTPHDIDLPLAGRGIECRGSGSHQIVFTFAGPVTVNSASVEGSGNVGSFTPSGSQIVVDLAGVADAQTLTINLNGVTDGSGTGNVSVRMGTLLGDTNGNGSVTSSDLSEVKSQSGRPLSAANFRSDVNANGGITSSDIGMVKARSGAVLPP